MLVGGGPAPGINGVIAAATIEANNHGLTVIGCQDGYKWLVKGDKTRTRTLLNEEVVPVSAKGGSILGTSRTNPAKDPQHMANVLKVFREMEIDALVSIGGDDTAYSGSQVYANALKDGKPIRVAHVPKTIDNDIPLDGSTPTFGFETARHYGAQVLRALAEDARTTSRWYIVVSMGRAAGHLAVGIGKSGGSHLTLIPEEFGKRQDVPLDEVCDIIIGSILKRRALPKARMYGVAVLAEGLIEKIGETQLKSAMGENFKLYCPPFGLRRDDFGHLRLGDIQFGRLVKDYMTERLAALGLAMTLIDKDLGYELRCANPIPFDIDYTHDLGYGAVKFLRSDEAGRFGAVISFVGGRMKPLAFDMIINPETKRMDTRLVDTNSESYEAARFYMYRLERLDFENPAVIEQMAALTKIPRPEQKTTAGDAVPESPLTPDEFRQKFGYLVGM